MLANVLAQKFLSSPLGVEETINRSTEIYTGGSVFTLCCIPDGGMQLWMSRGLLQPHGSWVAPGVDLLDDLELNAINVQNGPQLINSAASH